MAEKDLQKVYHEETSFIGDQQHGQEYHIIEKSEVPEPLLDEGAQKSAGSALNEPSGHQRGLKPAAGIIMRIGRGVKSAVGGAVNMIMQTGKCSEPGLLFKAWHLSHSTFYMMCHAPVKTYRLYGVQWKPGDHKCKESVQ